MIKLKHAVRTGAAVIATALASLGYAKTGPEIQYLDTYDQLSTVMGQEGHWFVRDAANSKTEQHGDPTVQQGWAIYTWDTKLSKFRKICEEESLDNSVSEALLRQYVRTAVFESTIAGLNSKFVTLTDYNTAMTAINTKIQQSTTKVAALEALVNGMSTKVKEAGDNATYAKQQVLVVKQMIQDLNIDKVAQQLAAMSNVVYQMEGRVAILEATDAEQNRVIAATTNAVSLIQSELDTIRTLIDTKCAETLDAAKEYTRAWAPDYNTTSNRAANARAYDDYTVGKRKAPVTTGNFGIKEWTGTCIQDGWYEEDGVREEYVVTNAAKYVWKDQCYVRTSDDSGYELVSNVWELITFDEDYGEWYKDGSVVRGEYIPSTKEYKFTYSILDKTIDWTGFSVNKGCVIIDETNDYCHITFDMTAVVPEFVYDDTIVKTKDLISKRDLDDLSVPSKVFKPDLSLPNFGITNWYGVATGGEERQNVRAEWYSEYYSSEIIRNVWMISTEDDTNDWSVIDGFYFRMVPSNGVFQVTFTIETSESTNVFTCVSTDGRSFELNQEFGELDKLVLKAAVPDDTPETQLVTVDQLNKKRDFDDLIIEQRPAITNVLPFGITEWTGYIVESFFDDDDHYRCDVKTVWNDDPDDPHWDILASWDNKHTWDKMTSTIHGEFDPTNNCYNFYLNYYGCEVNFTGFNISTNVVDNNWSDLVVLTANFNQIVVDRIATLKDIQKGGGGGGGSTPGSVGKVDDLFFSPINTTNDNFGVETWVGEFSEGVSSGDEIFGLGVNIPVRAVWNETNKYWNINVDIGEGEQQTIMMFTGRYDRESRNFIFEGGVTDEGRITVINGLTWKNFYCDIEFDYSFFGLLKGRLHLEPENTKGERLQTDRDVFNKREYSDLTYYLDGFQPDHNALNFGVNAWTISALEGGLIGIWTTNEVVIGDEDYSVVVSNVWAVKTNGTIYDDLSSANTNYVAYITGKRNLISGDYDFSLISQELVFDWTGFNTNVQLGDTIYETIHVSATNYTPSANTKILVSEDIESKRDFTDIKLATGPFVLGTNGNFGVERWVGKYIASESPVRELITIEAIWRDSVTDNQLVTNGCWVIRDIGSLLTSNGSEFGYINGTYDPVTTNYHFKVYTTETHRQTIYPEGTTVVTTVVMPFTEFDGFHMDFITTDTGSSYLDNIEFILDAEFPTYELNDRIASENYVEQTVTNAYRAESRWDSVSRITLPNRETATPQQLWDVINSLVQIAQSKPVVPIKSDYALTVDGNTEWDFNQTWYTTNYVWKTKMIPIGEKLWECTDSLYTYQLKLVDDEFTLTMGHYVNNTFTPERVSNVFKKHDPIGAPYVLRNNYDDGHYNDFTFHLELSVPHTRFVERYD